MTIYEHKTVLSKDVRTQAVKNVDLKKLLLNFLKIRGTQGSSLTTKFLIKKKNVYFREFT